MHELFTVTHHLLFKADDDRDFPVDLLSIKYHKTPYVMLSFKMVFRICKCKIQKKNANALFYSGSTPCCQASLQAPHF